MALFGSVTTLRSQLSDPSRFAAAFRYVEELLTPQSKAHERIMGIREGDTVKIELEGGAFALEQVYRTKSPADVKWESHRAYIDIQVVVAGEEHMEVADVSTLRVSEDLTPGKDVLFYHPSPRASLLKTVGGQGAVFFPIDAHRPSMAIDTPVLVRKTVVKVPVE